MFKIIIGFIIGFCVAKFGFSGTVHKAAEASRSAIEVTDKAASGAESTVKKAKDTVKDAQNKIK